MLLRIPSVLTGEELAEVRHLLARAGWFDGKVPPGRP